MSKTLTSFKKAVLEFCINILETDLKNQLNDESVSKDTKLEAIKKLKTYFVNNQNYEKAAFTRDIEKQIKAL
jgi:hypothetical protein